MLPIRAFSYTGSQGATITPPANAHGLIYIISNPNSYGVYFTYNPSGLQTNVNLYSYTAYIWIDDFESWPSTLFAHFYGIGPSDDDQHLYPLRHFFVYRDSPTNDQNGTHISLTKASPFLIDFPSTPNN